MTIWACLNWAGLDYARFSLIQKPKRFGRDSSTRLLTYSLVVRYFSSSFFPLLLLVVVFDNN